MKNFLRSLIIIPISIFCFQNKIFSQCWNNGDFTSYDQSAWGDPSATIVASNLTNNFNTVYASTLGVVEVGIPGNGGFSMQFSSSKSVSDYLPSVGTPAALIADLADPLTSSSCGQFGGNVLALKLNVDFSDAGFLSDNAGIKFGDLIIYGLTSNTDLNGLTVRQFLDIVNTALGGGSTTDAISDLDAITVNINNAFSGGTVSSFAQQHLKKGWKSGDLTTYNQTNWGNGGSGNSNLLTNYGTVYLSTGYIFRIGSSSGNYYAQWTDPTILSSYLPANGAAAALNANYSDASSFTSSGIFGGNVAALKLNIDFSDAGFLSSTLNFHFGDLVLYGFTDLTDLNGKTVREFLQIANTVLAGGTTTYSLNDIHEVAIQLNGAFFNGTPSAWAQLHLKRGWQNGDLTTYVQSQWGNDASSNSAATILEANFNTVYAPVFGVLIVGDTYTMTFDNAAAIEDYLPQIGPEGSLTTTLNDPTDSHSGAFGGEVVALKLNVDFSDAGLLQNNSGLKFGDLTVCGFTTSGDNYIGSLTQSQVNALNGKTVRQLLNEMNIVLGAGTGTLGLTVTQLLGLASELNASFIDGHPNGEFSYTSTFTQLHLVNGSCDCGNTVTNHCPTATAINISTTVGSAVKFILQGADADNNSLTYSISQAPSHGIATIVGSDSILYTPANGYHGSDQLKYKASDGSCDAEATVNITIIVCPQGSGYWKNHPDAWPASAIPMLLGTRSYTQSQLITILNTPIGSGNSADASLIMADQEIAVKLNLANGSPDVAHLDDSIAAADALIGGNLIPMKVKPNTALGKRMISLASYFSSYNSGNLTTGCTQPALITSVQPATENEMQIPKGFSLENYPNPFSGSTVIRYALPDAESSYHVSLKLFDATGKEIKTLVNDEERSGWKTVRVNAQDLSAGIYFYRLTAGKFSEVKKMILVK